LDNVVVYYAFTEKVNGVVSFTETFA